MSNFHMRFRYCLLGFVVGLLAGTILMALFSSDLDCRLCRPESENVSTGELTQHPPDVLGAFARCVQIKDWEKAALLTWLHRERQEDHDSRLETSLLTCDIVERIRINMREVEALHFPTDRVFKEISDAAGLTGWYAYHGVAWADYDGDGDLDGYIAAHRPLLTPSVLIRPLCVNMTETPTLRKITVEGGRERGE